MRKKRKELVELITTRMIHLQSHPGYLGSEQVFRKGGAGQWRESDRLEVVRLAAGASAPFFKPSASVSLSEQRG